MAWDGIGKVSNAGRFTFYLEERQYLLGGYVVTSTVMVWAVSHFLEGGLGSSPTHTGTLFVHITGASGNELRLTTALPDVASRVQTDNHRAQDVIGAALRDLLSDADGIGSHRY